MTSDWPQNDLNVVTGLINVCGNFTKIDLQPGTMFECWIHYKDFRFSTSITWCDFWSFGWHFIRSVSTMLISDWSIQQPIRDQISKPIWVLGSYNLSVDELKAIMKHLRCTEPDGSELGTSTWRNGSMKLIDVLISASNIQGPDAFFLFPGKSCAALGKFSQK